MTENHRLTHKRANGSAEAANDRENFVEGAKFGARLILELLGDKLLN